MCGSTPASSQFTHVTVAPTGTVIVSGTNLKSRSATITCSESMTDTGTRHSAAPSMIGPPARSEKHAAAAADRNRIKRCIREAFRLEQENLGALDLLVRPPYGLRPSPDMVARLRELLSRLSR